MSVSQSRFGASARSTRCTWSSNTAWVGLLPLPAPAALRGRENPRLRAQLPRRPPAHPPPCAACFVSEVAVTERRIVLMRVVEGVDPIRAEHVRVADRVVAPPVVGLRASLRTRHDTVTGIPASASSDTSGYVIW